MLYRDKYGLLSESLTKEVITTKWAAFCYYAGEDMSVVAGKSPAIYDNISDCCRYVGSVNTDTLVWVIRRISYIQT